MSNWLIELLPLMNRTFSLYNSGQTVGSGGGISVNPVIKTSNIIGVIQPLYGDEHILFAKNLQEADTYFQCLQLLDIKNGDLIIDDANIKYRVLYFEDYNSSLGRYFAIIGKKLIT